MNFHRLALSIACCSLLLSPAFGQETATESPTESTEGTTDDSSKESVTESAEKAVDDAKEKVDEFAQQVDESEQAKEISAGILQPIYHLAEQISFPAFHWIAFAIMATGVVSYALQLVLTKLALLFRGSLNLSEIFSDALGLVISIVGLVLTTQAAAENSSFTQSPFAVISASVFGLIIGFLFFRWGHAQETQALTGRKVEAKKQ